MFSNKESFKKAYLNMMAERFGRGIEESHIDEQFDTLGFLITQQANINWKKTKEKLTAKQERQLVYFSMEFLIGKMLLTNLKNLGVYEVVESGLKELGVNLQNLVNFEVDAGLGNGGLGRLAACFMDSLASTNYLGHGNTIRYEYGFFKQKIENNKQVEVPDQWLTFGNSWEIKKPQHSVNVHFYGRVETGFDKGRAVYKLVDSEVVRAVPYDMPMIGYKNEVVNTLRLWSAEPSDQVLPKTKDFYTYLNETRQLCHGLYPDDSTEAGKLLRLKQQYFFVAAGIMTSIKNHLKRNDNLDNFHEKFVFQLNDTHPVLGIPELMRILIDEYNYGWDSAWKIVSHTFAYTNHTVMAEALERWPLHYIQDLLPRIYSILEEINRRFTILVRSKTKDERIIKETMIIRDGLVHMTNLAVAGSYSVNGVATLHTEILKSQVLRDFYQLFPDKFNNKTNGVSHRRFLMYANPQLSTLINNTIGEGWHTKPLEMKKLLKFTEDPKVIKEFLKIKQIRKSILAEEILKSTGIRVEINSIFDIQVKRLHAYKRQMLNIFHVIYLYHKLINDKSFKIYPRTFIFGAKAAPSYVFAKSVIELINVIANKVNNDSRVNKFMKVIFLENYDVSKAEYIMPGADVSEQISTAGKEASGTGNMKFMMNGALTLGTLDGANVEISELVGPENILIFGKHADEIDALRRSGEYDIQEIFQNDENVRNILNSLIDGTFNEYPEQFMNIYNEILLKNDEYFIFADFYEYVKAQNQVEALYTNKELWAKICLINIAKSGFFSSDRTIEEYVDDVWKLSKV
jgi:glycogen phosphorylase